MRCTCPVYYTAVAPGRLARLPSAGATSAGPLRVGLVREGGGELLELALVLRLPCDVVQLLRDAQRHHVPDHPHGDTLPGRGVGQPPRSTSSGVTGPGCFQNCL